MVGTSISWRVLPIMLALTFTGCSDRSVSGTYVAVDEGRTAMLQITEASDRQISGDYSSLIRQPDGTLDIFSSAVSGSVAGRQITLVFRSVIRSGVPQEITGTIDADALALAVPNERGEIQNIILKRADRSSYEAAAGTLRAASAKVDDAKAQAAARIARTRALQSLIDQVNAFRDSVEQGTEATQLSLRDLPGIEAQYRTLSKEARRMFLSECQYAAKPDPQAAVAAAEVVKAINNLEDHEVQLDHMISHEQQVASDRSSTIAALLRSVMTECDAEPEKVASADRQTRDTALEACGRVGEQDKAWAFAATRLAGAFASVQRVQEQEKSAIETIRSEANAAEGIRTACETLK